jgi:hypothetical protein
MIATLRKRPGALEKLDKAIENYFRIPKPMAWEIEQAKRDAARRWLAATRGKPERHARIHRYEVQRMNDRVVRLLVVMTFTPGLSLSGLAETLDYTVADTGRALKAAAEIHGLDGATLQAMGRRAETPEDIADAIRERAGKGVAV